MSGDVFFCVFCVCRRYSKCRKDGSDGKIFHLDRSVCDDITSVGIGKGGEIFNEFDILRKIGHYICKIEYKRDPESYSEATVLEKRRNTKGYRRDLDLQQKI